MTISPSGSWIWQNEHRRWIQNAQNSREPAWLGWKWVWNRLNRSENRFWTLGGSLGLNREYSGEYSIGSAEAKDRIGWGSARIWRAWTTLVFNLWSAWVRLGYSYRNFRRRVGITSGSDEADFCTSEFVWMSSTLWNDQKLFLTTLKIRVSPKILVFCDERGSDTNCWWEKPLVVALKHSEEIKHTVLFQQ